MTDTKVKHTVTHDRISVVAQFPNGDEFKASVGRTGERMSLSQRPGTPEITKEEFEVLKTLMTFRATETNKTRFERIAATCQQAIDLKTLVAIISAQG